MFEDFFTIYNSVEPPPSFKDSSKFEIPKLKISTVGFFPSNSAYVEDQSTLGSYNLDSPLVEKTKKETFKLVYPESIQTLEPLENKKQQVNNSVKSVKKFSDRQSFVKTMTGAYEQELTKRGMDPGYAKALVAQDALETNYGKSVIGDYNFGNITTNGNDWHKQTGSRKWKDFRSLEDYVSYKIDFLSNKRYQYFQTFSANSDVARSMQVLANRGYDPGNPKYGQVVAGVYKDILKYL